MAHVVTSSQVGKLVIIIFTLVVVAGPITGPQAIFGALAKRGLYSDSCNNATGADKISALSGVISSSSSASMSGSHVTEPSMASTDSGSDSVTAAPSHTNHETHIPCIEQEREIESAADMALSICNFACVVCGVLQDVLGAPAMAIGGLFMWTAAKSCAGLLANRGTMWLAMQSISAIASLGAFSAIGMVHLRDAAGGCPRRYGLYSFIQSAIWDAAVLFNFALAQLYQRVELPLAYMIYGLCGGLPPLICFSLWRPHMESFDADESAADTEDYLVDSAEVEEARAVPVVGNSSSPTPSAAQTAATRIKRTLLAAKNITLAPAYWIFCAHCAVVVTVGYLLITNVGTIARARGADDAQVQQTREMSTILMSAAGVTTVVPGQLVNKLGVRRGLLVCLVIECLLVVVTTTGLVISELPFCTLQAAYAVMLVWRVWGFGLCFTFLSWRFANASAGLGFSYGFAFTVAGALSLPIGGAAGRIIGHDPQRNLGPVILSLMGVTLIVEIAFAFVVARTSASLDTRADETVEQMPTDDHTGIQEPLLAAK